MTKIFVVAALLCPFLASEAGAQYQAAIPWAARAIATGLLEGAAHVAGAAVMNSLISQSADAKTHQIPSPAEPPKLEYASPPKPQAITPLNACGPNGIYKRCGSEDDKIIAEAKALYKNW